MAELQDYLADKSGSWSVGDEHLTMLAGFLANKDNSYAPNVPLLTLQILRGRSALPVCAESIAHYSATCCFKILINLLINLSNFSSRYSLCSQG